MKHVAGFCLPDDEQHLPVYFERCGNDYQPAQRLRSLEFVTDWRLAVDVGAHVGLWSRLLVERFQRVVAFEPVAEMRSLLERNVPSDRLEIAPYALGDREGMVDLQYEPTRSMESYVVERAGGKVPLKRLDDFALPALGYLKIDTEGYELQVLRGAEQTLRRHMPIVIIEEKFHGHKRFGQERYAAARFLESLGAVVLDRVIDDLILGWAGVPGKVNAGGASAGVTLSFADRSRNAAALHGKGDVAGAAMAYRMLLRDDPENPAILLLLAVASHQLGRHEEAINLCRRSLSTDPGHTPAHRILVALLRAAGDLDEAAAATEAAIMHAPDCADAYAQRALILSQQGKHSQAEACLYHLRRLVPDPSAIDTNRISLDIAHEALVRAPAITARRRAPSATH